MNNLPNSEVLLQWYDKNARDLPWRVGPAARQNGISPDPYAVWLSEIMLQQTTVTTVKAYFLRFISLWPHLSDLAAAPEEQVLGEWAGLGYYARARNLIKCAKTLEALGEFPNNYDDLIKLPGIGPYTAAAIAAIAFDRPETVVDGNVERVMARMFALSTPLPEVKPILKQHAAMLTPTNRAGDYAQAVMDLGATICTPKSPKCELCPWQPKCEAHRQKIAHSLPTRVKKQKKPTRFGVMYLAKSPDNRWNLERRPERGLLGGMLGWPGAPWGEHEIEAPPFHADWRRVDEEVHHVFTHFNLVLSLRICTVASADVTMNFQTVNAKELPTVMRKAYQIAASVLND